MAALDVWGSGATRTGTRAEKNSKIRLSTSLIIDLVEYWGPSLFVVVTMSRADPTPTRGGLWQISAEILSYDSGGAGGKHNRDITRGIFMLPFLEALFRGQK